MLDYDCAAELRFKNASGDETKRPVKTYYRQRKTRTVGLAFFQNPDYYVKRDIIQYRTDSRKVREPNTMPEGV